MLKFFGIYNFLDHFKNGSSTNENVSFVFNGIKCIWQPEWSWEQNGTWMMYDNPTCLQIENSYQNGKKSVRLDKGMYSKGVYAKLYEILFDCKYDNLNASNQSEIDDIYDKSNVKCRESLFCKYFYQKNVQNKWVRIVRRKLTMKKECENCVIM